MNLHFQFYTVISRRGYSNQFKTEDSKDDGIINGAISKNRAIYYEKKSSHSSLVLLNKKLN